MNNLILVSGPSGSGKTTLLNSYFSKDQKIITYTTREPRIGEVNGVSYNFISKSQFEKMLSEGKFINVLKYAGNYYGCNKEDLFDKLSQGDVGIAVDYSGYEDFKRMFPQQAIGIFLTTSKEEIIKRLSLRKNEQEMKTRLEKYNNEMKTKDKFDFVIDTSVSKEHSLNKFKQVIEENKKTIVA